MTDLRKRRTGATREALIRAASRQFALGGYEGTSVEAIAEEAGVNKALISYHFGGKQQLYSTVLLEPIHAAREEFGALLPPGTPPGERAPSSTRRAVDQMVVSVGP